ncbi:Crp/Fnr family transcriptional regulator [Marinimicrobium sp. ARAG 43.8]|uniref:Crp/Fnr family transcriptional regulator n=1 Tax=Marinimicrobium sp. ARAG 43.8 TaxID=3418719 RepID=UPI003CF4D50D
MHLPHKQSDAISDCAAHVSDAVVDLLADLKPAGEPVHFQAEPNLLDGGTSEWVWQITQGEAFYRVGGKQVSRHGAGDLLGLDQALPIATGVYGCHAPVTLVPYHRKDLEERHPQRFIRYLLYANAFHRAALSQEIRSEFQPATGFMHFQAGETIIHQGTEADRVYTLLEGEAQAMRDGIKVGDVRTDEIFGALAVFTRQKRMASVVAISDCTVLAVRKEEFADLVELQPRICLGLIEELAAKINEMNAQLLALQEKS